MTEFFINMITKYHAKYYANLLTQKAVGGELSSISQSLMSASVDINPHQIDAALFAFKSPLSKGIVLADEVGLGKTIEAGLVICQYWAIGKRKIIIVCPAALRKQWSTELIDKFGIDNIILDTKNYNEAIKNGRSPYSKNKAIICSYNFVARKKDEILMHGFDISIIDEAHKLRNVYRQSSKTSHAVRDALTTTKKLLLTATPFQNSLLELYGLTSIIDDHIFGSEKSFRSEYGSGENNADLRARLSTMYKRTLRRDVKEYINYTNRLPLTQKFDSTDAEYELYQAISDFLRRNDIYSVPAQQKKLTTMIIRKILASSTFALISTLTNIKSRLEKILETASMLLFTAEDLIDDDEEIDLYVDDNEDISAEEEDAIDIDKLKAEIELLQTFINKAKQIKQDSKSEALLQALDKSFEMQAKEGASRKALIFTESTKTQAYLKEYLEANGYEGKIVLFNGRGSDPKTTQIYKNWCEANPSKVSGIKSADRRMALVDYFRESADIMIATEAAGEGLNLQFCSLIVNYDLPWNPQRIEQRIGRCHRYGQKHDVVVVNFVNIRNYADVRVFNILNEKFNLFDDIFGASDEILGKADAIDFETRIWEIYQQCRTEEEINEAFDRLQTDMQVEIDELMKDTRHQILENFDIDVQEHLRVAKDEASTFLNRYEHILWELTKYVLDGKAKFDDKQHSFVLKKSIANCAFGKYDLLSQLRDGAPYRLSHPLAQFVLDSAMALVTDGYNSEVNFDDKENNINIILPDYLKCQSGYLVLSKLQISSFENEQYCLFTAFTDDGNFLTQEETEKLFLCGGTEQNDITIPKSVVARLDANSEQHATTTIKKVDSRNLSFFKEEENRIYRWERDVIDGIEQELDTVKRNIRETERLARLAENIEERIRLEAKVEDLRRQKRRKRNELEDREDEISIRRRNLVAELEKKMIQTTSSDTLFVVRWSTN